MVKKKDVFYERFSLMYDTLKHRHVRFHPLFLYNITKRRPTYLTMKVSNGAIIAVLACASPTAIAFQSQSAAGLRHTSAFVGNNNKGISPLSLGLPSSSSRSYTSSYGSPVSVVVSSSASSTAESSEEIDIFKEAEAIFDCVDVNKDGAISAEELRIHLVDQMGYSAEYTQFLFDSMDMDSDGEISREEFRFAFYNFEAVSMYMTFGVVRLCHVILQSLHVRFVCHDKVLPSCCCTRMTLYLTLFFFHLLQTTKLYVICICFYSFDLCVRIIGRK